MGEFFLGRKTEEGATVCRPQRLSRKAFIPMHAFASSITMSVGNLSPAQLRAAMQQLVSSPGFGLANHHLSAAEISAIPNGTWPQRPVFTPYAITHHGYSQS
jgi:hypothetical protein